MQEIHEVVDDLIAFVKRASGKGATPEEIAVLPEVARVLLMYGMGYLDFDKINCGS